VTIPATCTEVSSQHAEFTLVDFDVRVRDLGSKFGTQVLLPSRPLKTLRSHEETGIVPGTMVRLANVVGVIFEATP
jgi:hypothetical protein